MAYWNETISKTELELLDTLIVGINDRRFGLEENFWDGVIEFMEGTDVDKMVDWLVKLVVDLEKLEKEIVSKKIKKLKKLCGKNNSLKGKVELRMDEHKKEFYFTKSIFDYGLQLSEDFSNLVNLLSLDFNSSNSNISADSTLEFPDNASQNMSGGDSMTQVEQSSESNACAKDANSNRYIGKFVNDNVINLSSRSLSKAEVSLLSKGLKFVPTPSSVNKIKLKEELEVFGRKLRLQWHFRDDDREFIPNPFVKKINLSTQGGKMQPLRYI